MSGADSLKLVAHRSGFDLLISVAELIEIVASEDLIWESGDDSGLRACRFRGELLPVPDFASFLGEPPLDQDKGGHLLVIGGEAAPFGVMVSRIYGIFPTDQFRYRDLPLMLRSPDTQCYASLALWDDKVLISCDGVGLEACCR